MKRYNIILLVDHQGSNVLMCHRQKPPYQGLYNLVGGKAMQGEDGLHAAYRELREETGVTAADASLVHLSTFSYLHGGAGLPAYALECYAGRLRQEVNITGDENPLCWMPVTENFFDLNRFAGEGSIGHLVESVRRYCPWMIEPHEPEFTLLPLAKDDLSTLAFYQHCSPDKLLPMLAESQETNHDGRYYEQFVFRMDGCVIGQCSLYAREDGTVSEGIEIFPPFRNCGFSACMLNMLEDAVRVNGYHVLTAQVRTDNAASIALHESLGFEKSEPWTNRRGHPVYTFRKLLVQAEEDDHAS